MKRAVNRILVVLVCTPLLVGAPALAAQEVMAISEKVVRLTTGDYIVAGDIMAMSDDDVASQYWYCRISPSGEIVHRGAIDVPDDHDPALGGIVGTSDGGFLILGRFEGHLWKVDAVGAVTKLGRLLQGDGTVNFLVKSGTGYLAGGSDFGDYENSVGILLKLDAQGNVLWRKSFDRGEMDEIWGAVPSVDGSYVFAMSSGSHNKFGTGDLDGILMRCDEDGNVTKETKIPGLQLMPKLDRSGDEYVLLGLVAPKAEPNERKPASITVMAFSEELEGTWNKTIDSFETMLFTPEFVATEDGRYALVGQPPMNMEGDKFRDIPDANIRLTTFGSDGVEEFTTDLRLQKMKKRGSMSFASVGFMNGLVADGANLVFATHLTSMETEKVDVIVQKIRASDGEVLWEKRGNLRMGGPDFN